MSAGTHLLRAPQHHGGNSINDEHRPLVLHDAFEGRRAEEPVRGLQVRLVATDGATSIQRMWPEEGAETLGTLKGMVAGDLCLMFLSRPGQVP